MTYHNPWASSLDRAAECPPSCVYPKASTSGEAADNGVDCHEFIQTCAEAGRAAALELAPPTQLGWLERIDVAKIWDGLADIRVERVYALDVVGQLASELEKRDDNKYDRPDTEFLGRCDYVAVAADGTPVAGDHKTGVDMGPPSSRWQMRFFAIVLWLMNDRPAFVEIRFDYIAEDGSVKIVAERVGVMDIEQWLGELAGLRGRLLAAKAVIEAGGVPNVRSGDWCKFCPTFHQCPAKLQFVRQVLPQLTAAAELADMMSPTELGVAWSQYTAFKQLVERIGTVIEEAVERPEYVSGLPLPNGNTLRPMRRVGKAKVNISKLLKVAADAGATKAAIDACSSTSSYYAKVEVKP